MKVIAEITTDPAGPKTVQAWDTLKDMRAALRAAVEQHGPIMADVYCMPDVAGDPFGLDVPTWRIIRTPEQFIRTEMFS